MTTFDHSYFGKWNRHSLYSYHFRAQESKTTMIWRNVSGKSPGIIWSPLEAMLSGQYSVQNMRTMEHKGNNAQ